MLLAFKIFGRIKNNDFILFFDSLSYTQIRGQALSKEYHNFYIFHCPCINDIKFFISLKELKTSYVDIMIEIGHTQK